jgi:hypothetical protein
MSSIVIAGDTSGSITVAAPAVAGSGTVLTLPTVTGTLLSTTGGALTASQGGTGLTSPGTNGNVLTSNGTTWVSSTPAPSGTVTSVATGNGLQGGTITTSGTLSLAAPNFNTVGSYAYVFRNSANGSMSSGASISPGTGLAQVQSTYIYVDFSGYGTTNNLSGTYRWMGGDTGTSACIGIAVRLA